MAIFNSCCRCYPPHTSHKFQLSKILRSIDVSFGLVVIDVYLHFTIEEVVCSIVLVARLENDLSLRIPFLFEAVGQLLLQIVVV